MNDLFLNTFFSVFQGIIKIFIIGAVAGILVWRKIIKQEHIDGLSAITVIIFLPCLIFSSITSGFHPDQLKFWWLIPVGTIIITSAGIGITALLFIPDMKKHKNILPLSSINNAVYLILPIGEFVYSDQFDQFAVYCFIVVLGMSPMLWSVGIYFVTEKKSLSFKQFFNAPFVANLLALILVLAGVQHYTPPVITDSVDMLGKATVPAATFILGATLAGTVRVLPGFWETFRISFVKFVIIPLITIILLKIIRLNETDPLLADVLVIQAAAAPATGFILQVRTYGGNLKKISGIIFISYFVALIAIPLWLTVWKMITI
jgi:predicted permease